MPRSIFTLAWENLICFSVRCWAYFWFEKCIPVIGDFKVSSGYFGIQDPSEFEDGGGKAEREHLTIGQCDLPEPGPHVSWEPGRTRSS